MNITQNDRLTLVNAEKSSTELLRFVRHSFPLLST